MVAEIFVALDVAREIFPLLSGGVVRKERLRHPDDIRRDDVPRALVGAPDKWQMQLLRSRHKRAGRVVAFVLFPAHNQTGHIAQSGRRLIPPGRRIGHECLHPFRLPQREPVRKNARLPKSQRSASWQT